MWHVGCKWDHCYQEEQRSSTHKGEHLCIATAWIFYFISFLLWQVTLKLEQDHTFFLPWWHHDETSVISHTIIHTSCTCSFRNMLLVACCLNKFSLSLKLQMSADNLACPSSNFPSHQLAHQCSPNIIGIWEWSICGLMGGAFMAYWVVDIYDLMEGHYIT